MPPNILIITTDQQRFDSLSCYGSSFTFTPNLDRLADEGVLCKRAYCANPVCTPARASIFSGMNVSRHGAWNVGMAVPENVPLLSHRLANLGYRTHYIGKAHFQSFLGEPDQSIELVREGQDRYPGFTGPYYGFQTVELAPGHVNYGMTGHYGAWVRSQVTEAEFLSYQQLHQPGKMQFGGEAYDWDLPVHLHNSVWTADRTIEFLQKQTPDQPFFLAIGFQDPHHPHGVPKAFSDRVLPESVPLPRYQEGELEDKPPFFLQARHGKLEQSSVRGEYEVAGQGAGYDYSQVPEDEARLSKAYYYSMVRLIDQQMGRILGSLDDLNLANDTLVIFTTDHGELLGDHGLWMKGPFHYEELIRIPMLFRWKNGLPGGMRTQGLLSQVDLVPTVLAALGVTAEGMDGINALPMLRGELTSVRPSVLIETVDDPKHLRLKTIVTQDRKLTFYHQKPFGELYDLNEDPGECVNLWDDSAYALDKQTLLMELLDYSERLEYPQRSERIGYA